MELSSIEEILAREAQPPSEGQSSLDYFAGMFCARARGANTERSRLNGPEGNACDTVVKKRRH